MVVSDAREGWIPRPGVSYDRRCRVSYRDVEKLLGERVIEVDHVTVYRWVHHATPRGRGVPRRHTVGDGWFVDETDVKITGKWRSVYRAVDRYGQIIDVLVSARRDLRAARRSDAALARFADLVATPST
jgi:transposase, IS6 family